MAAESAGFAAPGGKGGWFCHTPMVAIARNVGRKRAMELRPHRRRHRRGDRAGLGAGQPRSCRTASWTQAVDALLARATRGSAVSKGLGKQTMYAQMSLDEHGRTPTPSR